MELDEVSPIFGFGDETGCWAGRDVLPSDKVASDQPLDNWPISLHHPLE